MTNILVNPCAENGATGWTYQPSNGWLRQSIVPRSGSLAFLNNKVASVSMSQSLNFVVDSNCKNRKNARPSCYNWFEI